MPTEHIAENEGVIFDVSANIGRKIKKELNGSFLSGCLARFSYFFMIMEKAALICERRIVKMKNNYVYFYNGFDLF